MMTNETAVEALEQIRTYCAADLLDALDYVTAVMRKLDADGVKRPLDTDFTKLK